MKVTPIPAQARAKLSNLWIQYKSAEQNFQNYIEALCIGLKVPYDPSLFVNMDTFNLQTSEPGDNVVPMMRQEKKAEEGDQKPIPVAPASLSGELDKDIPAVAEKKEK